MSLHRFHRILHQFTLNPLNSLISSNRYITTYNQLGMNHTVSTTIQPPRAAACIIGNEILSGKIIDTNTAYLAKQLFLHGIDLIEIRVVPDQKDVIVDCIRALSDKVGSDGYVFTSGGIGMLPMDRYTHLQHTLM